MFLILLTLVLALFGAPALAGQPELPADAAGFLLADGLADGLADDLARASGPVGGAQDVRILYYPAVAHVPDRFDRLRLEILGYDVTGTTDPADLDIHTLRRFDVLVLFQVGPGELGAQQGAIEQFVGEGGSLYIHQPNAAGTIDYAPTGFQVRLASAAVDSCATSCLTGAVHPVVDGLSDADLGGAFDRVSALGPGYTRLLAVSCTCGDPALAAGRFGLGAVVFDTSNLALQAALSPSDAYVVQVFAFLHRERPVAVEAASLTELKAMFR